MLSGLRMSYSNLLEYIRITHGMFCIIYHRRSWILVEGTHPTIVHTSTSLHNSCVALRIAGYFVRFSVVFTYPWAYFLSLHSHTAVPENLYHSRLQNVTTYTSPARLRQNSEILKHVDVMTNTFPYPDSTKYHIPTCNCCGAAGNSVWYCWVL
jgi:hypothetical protein